MIHNFFRKYASHIFTAPNFETQALTGTQLKEACQRAKQSVAGLDHFSPEDFAMLSDLAYEWLAHLLSIIEDGAGWPKDLLKGKAAFLSKPRFDL